MLTLRKTRRAIAMTAATIALAGGTAFAAAGSASAAGSNWSIWAGSCFGWTIFNNNQVTGWVNAHNGHHCTVSIGQWDTLNWNNNPNSSASSETWGGITSTPTYWHGYASDGGVLWDRVYICDMTVGTCSDWSGWYN